MNKLPWYTREGANYEKGDILAVAYYGCFRLGIFTKFGTRRAVYFYDVLSINWLVKAEATNRVLKTEAKEWHTTTPVMGRMMKVKKEDLMEKQIELVEKAMDYLKTKGLL